MNSNFRNPNDVVVGDMMSINTTRPFYFCESHSDYSDGCICDSDSCTNDGYDDCSDRSDPCNGGRS